MDVLVIHEPFWVKNVPGVPKQKQSIYKPKANNYKYISRLKVHRKGIRSQESLCLQIPQLRVLPPFSHQLVVGPAFQDLRVVHVPMQRAAQSSPGSSVVGSYAQDNIGRSCELPEPMG